MTPVTTFQADPCACAFACAITLSLHRSRRAANLRTCPRGLDQAKGMARSRRQPDTNVPPVARSERSLAQRPGAADSPAAGHRFADGEYLGRQGAWPARGAAASCPREVGAVGAIDGESRLAFGTTFQPPLSRGG